MGNYVDVTDANFDTEVLKAELPVLVDFWAIWCVPCRMIAPIIEDLATAKKDKLKVVKLDVDHNPQTATKYGIRSIPTLLVFKNGQIVDKFLGAVPKSLLESKLSKHL
jgi:thioredoxin 1